MADGLAVGDVLGSAAARTKRIRLVLDGNLIDRHNELLAELARAVEHYGAESVEAEAIGGRVVASEAEVEAAEVEFVFRALGRGRWRKLIADHPPTEEQLEANPNARFDTGEFPFVAMAACLVEPNLTEADLRQLEETVLDVTMFGQLWGACLDVNIGEAVNRPESAAARFALRSARLRSEQPSDSESAAAV